MRHRRLHKPRLACFPWRRFLPPENRERQTRQRKGENKNKHENTAVAKGRHHFRVSSRQILVYVTPATATTTWNTHGRNLVGETKTRAHQREYKFVPLLFDTCRTYNTCAKHHHSCNGMRRDLPRGLCTQRRSRQAKGETPPSRSLKLELVHAVGLLK